VSGFRFEISLKLNVSTTAIVQKLTISNKLAKFGSAVKVVIA
jgi:hypothetical protein